MLKVKQPKVSFDIYYINQLRVLGLTTDSSTKQIQKKIKEASCSADYLKNCMDSNLPQHYATLELPLGANYECVNKRYYHILRIVNKQLSRQLRPEKRAISGKSAMSNADALVVVKCLKTITNKYTGAYQAICDHLKAIDKSPYYFNLLENSQDPIALAQQSLNDDKKRDVLFERYCKKIIESINLNAYRESFGVPEKVLDNFHAFNISKKLPEDVYRFRTKLYLFVLKQTIIDPLCNRINRLQNEKKPSENQAQLLTQFKIFFDAIGKVLHETVYNYLLEIKKSILLDFGETHFDADSPNEFGDLIRLQNRIFNDMGLRISLHRNLCRVLHEYGYIDNSKIIARSIELLKKEFFKRLSFSFRILMENEHKETKDALKTQIQKTQFDFKENQNIADKARIAFFSISSLATSEKDKKVPNYGLLTENIRAVIHALERKDTFEAGQELRQYVERTRFQTGCGLRLLYVGVMAVGLALAIFGVLVATTMIVPTLGLSLPAGIKISASGGALFAIGAARFAYARPKNALKTIRQTAEALENASKSKVCENKGRRNTKSIVVSV